MTRRGIGGRLLRCPEFVRVLQIDGDQLRHAAFGHGDAEQAVDVSCSMYYTLIMSQQTGSFGSYVRRRREHLKACDPAFSVRQVASRVGIEPAYLSKIERDEMAPPGEETICKLATELDEDADALLAMAGKVSSDLRAIIMRRPRLFADLIRQLKNSPDHAILRIVRQVNDGTW